MVKFALPPLYIRGKNTGVCLNRRFGWPQSWSGRFGVEKNLFTTAGNRIPDRLVHRVRRGETLFHHAALIFLVFIIEIAFVYCAVRTGSFDLNEFKLSLRRVTYFNGEISKFLPS